MQFVRARRGATLQRHLNFPIKNRLFSVSYKKGEILISLIAPESAHQSHPLAAAIQCTLADKQHPRPERRHSSALLDQFTFVGNGIERDGKPAP